MKQIKKWVKVLSIACVPAVSLGAKAIAADVTFACTISTIEISGDSAPFDSPRITINCQNSYGNISYFAYLISSNPVVAQMIVNTYAINVLEYNLTKVSVQVFIKFDPNDTSGNGWGCGSSNCRIIKKIFLL